MLKQLTQKPHSLSTTIWTPEARYINVHIDFHDESLYKMYHNNTADNDDDIVTNIIHRGKGGGWKKIQTPFITEGCDSMDVSGFCDGHDMTRDEFIEVYCGGVCPPELEEY